jgi:L-ascorbate metabolism protein UlaG (beta-lactamase superfamily)
MLRNFTTMKLTWIDLNSWIFQLAGKTVLVDPWLVDPLVFGGQSWLFTASHIQPLAYTPETLPAIDLILLSQGVDDHTHVPTLEKLDRRIPVVASPTAAKVVKKLGYEQVTTLAAWEETTIAPDLKITAVLGAEIQPGQVENGYLLKDQQTGETLYYEPHLSPVQASERVGQVDVAIAPVIGQIFPLLGQVIMGPEQTLQMVQALRPRFFLPTTRGEIRATGILPMLIKSVGSVEEFRDRLIASGLPTQLLVPSPGETVELGNNIQ